VTATSPVGEGRVSAKSLAVVMGTPSSPTQVTATQAAAAALTVSWIPGSSNGVSTSSYVATAEPGGKVCSASVLTSCAISGLVNGSYSLTVVAKNALGASKPSTPAATAHVIGPPGAPRAVTVIPNNASATVSWTIPTYVGEGKVRYVVTSNTGVKHCITSAATSCTIDGLHNGSTYSFTVVATNVAGDGARSAPSSPVIVGAPGAPRGLTATAGNGAALLIWTAPLTGGTIKSYVVTSQPGDKNCTTSRTSCTVSGLTNGKVYTFKIQARNSFGVSPGAKVTNAVTPSTLPMAPTAVTATTSHESATITWVAGGAIGVSVRVSGYVVTASPGGQTCSASASTVLSCTVTGLTKGQSYTFSVKETSASGTGPASRSSKSVTIIDVPDAPSGVVSTAQDSSVVVT
jgi:predicted RNA-binding protein with TRAM domain